MSRVNLDFRFQCRKRNIRGSSKAKKRLTCLPAQLVWQVSVRWSRKFCQVTCFFFFNQAGRKLEITTNRKWEIKLKLCKYLFAVSYIQNYIRFVLYLAVLQSKGKFSLKLLSKSTLCFFKWPLYTGNALFVQTDYTSVILFF